MKVCLTVIVLFVFMANDVGYADKIELVQKLPLCEGKGCFVVATSLPWKISQQKRGLRVKSGPFVVTIPANVTWVGLGVTVTVFKYHNAPLIAIGSETIDSLQLNTKDINLSQALKYIFSNTMSDYEISNTYNSELWNKLMLIKKSYLEKSGKAFIFETTSFNVYFIPDAGEPFNNIAWAVDERKPGSALRIESNMDSIKFKEILFSIRLSEN